MLVEDPRNSQFLHVRKLEYGVMRQCNGQNTLEQIRHNIHLDFGDQLSIGKLKRFVSRLRDLNLLESGNEFAIQQGHLRGGWLQCRFRLFDPDSLLELLVPPLRFTFTAPCFAFSVVFVMAAIGLVMSNAGEIGSDLRQLAHSEFILPVLLVAFPIGLVHELAHGVACKRFGGRVREIGIMVIYFVPALYCNVSSAWRFPFKSHRLWVTFAGIWSSILVWACAVFVWRFSIPGSLFNSIALFAIAATGVECLFNLNPLIKLDGYYLLSDALGIPNLRQRSFDFLTSQASRMFGRSIKDETPTNRQQRWIFAIYGLLSSTYSLTIICVVGYYTGVFLMHELQLLGLTLFMMVIFIIFRERIASLARWCWRGSRDRTEDQTKKLQFATSFAAVGLPALIACAYPWETTILADVEVAAFQKEEIRAQVDGRIAEIMVREGDSVSCGDPVLRINNPELVAELNQVIAESKIASAKLALLKRGARPQHIAMGKAQLDTAKVTLEHARLRLAESKSLHAANMSRAASVVAEATIGLNHARAEFGRMEQLRKQNAVSHSEFEKSRITREQWALKLDVAKADQRRIESDRHAVATEIAAVAEMKIDEATHRLELICADPLPEEIAAAQAEIDRLEARRVYLQNQVQLLESGSRIAGLVTTQNLEELIDLPVIKGQPVIRVQNISHVAIELQVQENEVGKVDVGQAVIFRTWAYPQREFRGRVSNVAATATFADAKPSNRSFVVKTLIPNEGLLLKPGMTGKAKICTGEHSLGSLVFHELRKSSMVEVWSWFPRM